MPFQKGHKLSTGRPKASHTYASEEMKRELVQKIKKNWKMITDTMIEMAIEQKNLPALLELMNRAIGKNADVVETTSSQKILVIQLTKNIQNILENNGTITDTTRSSGQPVLAVSEVALQDGGWKTILDDKGTTENIRIDSKEEE